MKKIISLFARNYDGDRMVRNEIRDYLSTAHIEGIVWHHDDPALAEIVDGRMVKIKTRDFA